MSSAIWYVLSRGFNVDALVKSPDAALRFIFSHCGVRQVRLISSDLRALPAAFLRARREKSKKHYFVILSGVKNLVFSEC
jgi:hypothetical protein